MAKGGLQTGDAILAIDGIRAGGDDFMKFLRTFLQTHVNLEVQFVRLPEIPLLEDYKKAVKRGMVHRMVKQVEVQANTAARWGKPRDSSGGKHVRRESTMVNFTDDTSPSSKPRRLTRQFSPPSTKIQYAQAAVERQKRKDAAVCIQKHARAFLARWQYRRRVRELVEKSQAEAKELAIKKLNALDDAIIAEQAALAWAFDNDAVQSVTISRSSVSESLGMDVTRPPQAIFHYNGLPHNVSEPFLLCTGMRVCSLFFIYILVHGLIDIC